MQLLCKAYLQLALEAILLHPLRHIILVAAEPVGLGLNAVKALCQAHSESLRASRLEELLDSLLLLWPSEARRADGDDGAQDSKPWWKLLVELLPVLTQPDEQCLNTLSMCAKSREWHVDVLLLNLVAQCKSERALDQLWLTSTA